MPYYSSFLFLLSLNSIFLWRYFVILFNVTYLFFLSLSLKICDVMWYGVCVRVCVCVCVRARARARARVRISAACACILIHAYILLVCVWNRNYCYTMSVYGYTLLSCCLTSTEARWPIRDGDRVGRGRESERLGRGNRPKKTGETMDRRQNNGSVKAVSPRHCPATCSLRNCSFNCCAGQSH